MEYYSAEVATPPLALVTLLGCPALHPTMGEYLRTSYSPPINSQGVADSFMAARLFGAVVLLLQLTPVNMSVVITSKSCA